MPHLSFEINGTINTLSQVEELLQTGAVQGCMIGRAAFYTPWSFADVDRRLAGLANPGLSPGRYITLLTPGGGQEGVRRGSGGVRRGSVTHPLVLCGR
jgi:tRNA-dihydrouridine synthase